MLKTATKRILRSLSDVISNLNEVEYSRDITVISETPVSKHVRHILDFYLCLLNSVEDENKIICYDKRERRESLESHPSKAVHLIDIICSAIDHLPLSEKLYLKQKVEGVDHELPTSVERELLYNLEHAIHHMAIIKIAINEEYRHISLVEDFGVAASTLAHRNNLS